MKNRLIKNLSKGYRQRVGIAFEVLGFTQRLLFWMSRLSVLTQTDQRNPLIKWLPKQKHTVILSSHILSEVSAVCDYVLIISHGKLVASDTHENLGKLA